MELTPKLAQLLGAAPAGSADKLPRRKVLTLNQKPDFFIQP